MNGKKEHPIGVVSRRTGLSPDVLRAWEHRYAAVQPARSSGGQRYYSDADIDRLRLIGRALAAGRRIGQVARLTTEEVERLVRKDQRAEIEPDGGGARCGRALTFLEEALEAVRAMNSRRLESILGRAALALDAVDLIDHLVAPLMIRIGDLWRRDRLTPGHERMATTVVRRTLEDLRANAQSDAGLALVVATPSGQHHEMGALLAAAAAAADGCHVIYLGADLPAASIATAVEMTGAQAVALSLIYPASDPSVDAELRALRRLLPAEVPILVGGQAAGSYRGSLDAIRAIRLTDAAALRSALDDLDRRE